MAPLKPFTNFKFKHIFSLVPINPFSSSQFIVTKTRILLPPSLELQNGSSKPLFTTSASNLGTIVGVENVFHLILTLLFQNQRKPRRLNENLTKCLKIFGLQNCLQ